jgi:hypothetical protein
MLKQFAVVFAITAATMFTLNFIAGTAGAGSSIHTIIKGS